MTKGNIQRGPTQRARVPELTAALLCGNLNCQSRSAEVACGNPVKGQRWGNDCLCRGDRVVVVGSLTQGKSRVSHLSFEGGLEEDTATKSELLSKSH